MRRNLSTSCLIQLYTFMSSNNVRTIPQHLTLGTYIAVADFTRKKTNDNSFDQKLITRNKSNSIKHCSQSSFRERETIKRFSRTDTRNVSRALHVCCTHVFENILAFCFATKDFEEVRRTTEHRRREPPDIHNSRTNLSPVTFDRFENKRDLISERFAICTVLACVARASRSV